MHHYLLVNYLIFKHIPVALTFWNTAIPSAGTVLQHHCVLMLLLKDHISLSQTLIEKSWPQNPNLINHINDYIHLINKVIR